MTFDIIFWSFLLRHNPYLVLPLSVLHYETVALAGCTRTTPNFTPLPSQALDAELTAATGVPSRPKPTDFDILDELGDGNFSKIFKAEYKPTKKVYAIKVIIVLLELNR